MKAVWKRDLTAYFNSPVGCVFLFAFATIMNLCFYVFNVLGASSQISNLFSIMLFLLILITPFLTMRLFSEEYKLRTDQLLLTSPTDVWEIVLGKFLAAFCVFALALALTLVWVIVIGLFGVLSPGAVAGNYAAILCAAAAFISVGMLVSSLTENQIIAAVGTLAVFLGLFALSAAAESSLSPVMGTVLSWFSLFARHQRFLLGIFSLSDILYYISFTGVMLFLTSRVLEKKRWA
ncbi:ABC transporter permease [Bacilliculturomica massiliensis]|uniref:ABC transporter permease n=1 Tax=Bacilliculturomica massiliensis TaxID=1917867 RepID=UPI00102FBDEF|nr:ABC transporter permease [Bacilliculturomica massiliensis]